MYVALFLSEYQGRRGRGFGASGITVQTHSSRRLGKRSHSLSISTRIPDSTMQTVHLAAAGAVP
jgi:hypothetical protein